MNTVIHLPQQPGQKTLVGYLAGYTALYTFARQCAVLLDNTKPESQRLAPVPLGMYVGIIDTRTQSVSWRLSMDRHIPDIASIPRDVPGDTILITTKNGVHVMRPPSDMASGACSSDMRENVEYLLECDPESFWFILNTLWPDPFVSDDLQVNLGGITSPTKILLSENANGCGILENSVWAKIYDLDHHRNIEFRYNQTDDKAREFHRFIAR